MALVDMRTGYILLLAIISGVLCQEECDNSTFSCRNGNCIPLDKVNNTVNDCMDNSDEVSFQCEQQGNYHCTNGACRVYSWVLDGSDDCGDKSDEAKIIGGDCSMVKRVWSTGETIGCCDCDVYVPHSECVKFRWNNITCVCKSGFYSNDLGTECLRRKIRDYCSEDADCYDAFDNSSCVNNACSCDIGYYDSDDLSTCVARLIGDHCAVDPDCSTVVAHSNCTTDKCMCNSGYYRSDNLTMCILREVGEGCIFNYECAGLGNSTCVNGTCMCARGFNTDLGPSVCNMRRIDEDCIDKPDCPVAGSNCVNETCTCDIGRYPSFDKKFCPLRVVGDSCKTNLDCTSSFPHSLCLEKSRGRMCKCDVGYEGSTGAARCHSIDNNNNIILVAFNVFMISFLAIVIVWLIMYFRRA